MQADDGKEEIANLLGNDVMKRFRDFLIASNLPMAAAAVVGGTTTLHFILGPPALVGVGYMFFTLVINMKLASVLGQIEHSVLKGSDNRLQVLQEIVTSIKAKPPLPQLFPSF